MTIVDTKQLRALLDAATPGPWEDEAPYVFGAGGLAVCDTSGVHERDAALIAALRNAAPHLLDELDALRAAAEAARGVLGSTAAHLAFGDDLVPACRALDAALAKWRGTVPR